MLKDFWHIFLIFLRLGLISFGGPVAHLGYFHNEFVAKRRWLNEHAYADLVALCQFLPGPASSQVGIALGLSRAGIPGALAAWVGFTLPSAFFLYLFALGISSFGQHLGTGWLHGIKIVAVAIVGQAIWVMARKLCPDFKRALIGLVAMVGSLFIPSVMGQVAVITMGALLGLILMKSIEELPHAPFNIQLNSKWAVSFLALFVALIVTLPLTAARMNSHGLKLFDSFFRVGSLVFGGGHVVLPLLKNEVVNPGWVMPDAFMAGYGAAQAVPGPLFTFSAYLGAISRLDPSGILGAVICLVGAFLPSFLLIFGVLPFWEKLRTVRSVRTAMLGVNAAVVGLLAAAFYDPVWTSAIFSLKDFILALVCFSILMKEKLPSWCVVLIGAVCGFFLF